MRMITFLTSVFLIIFGLYFALPSVAYGIVVAVLGILLLVVLVMEVLQNG